MPDTWKALMPTVRAASTLAATSSKKSTAAGPDGTLAIVCLTHTSA